MMAFDFRPELWRNRLDRMGEAVRWLRRLPCPCQDATQRRPQRDCAACRGTGWRHEEQDCSAYRALLTNQVPRQVFSSMGQFRIGDIVCQTMPDEIPLAPRDVLILPTRWDEHNQLLIRGADDALRAWPVSELVAVTDEAQSYEPGVDCQVGDDERTVEWLTAGPTEGATYSVRYRFYPTYDIIEMLPHRRKAVGGVRLPQAVILRLRSLAQGEEAWAS